MIFISNRPTAITNIQINPVRLAFDFADAFSFGLATRWVNAARQTLEDLSLQFRVDPVLAYVNLANVISGGYAARTLCISMQQLEKDFLAQHFRQHYETVLSSLSTWRRFPDWQNEKSLPPWVISGADS